MVRKNWYYTENKNNIPTAINVSSVVRFYPKIRKIGIFLAFYRYNQFINVEYWIDENSRSFDKPNLISGNKFLDDEHLETRMANWLDKRAKEIYGCDFKSKHFSLKGIEKSYPDLFGRIHKLIWNIVYS